MNKFFFILITVLTLVGAACNRTKPSPVTTTDLPEMTNIEVEYRDVDFSGVNQTFKFFGKINPKWQVEYVSGTDALNIYDLDDVAPSNLEKSQIFIRHFKANSFLTLTTVNIFSRQEAFVGDHAAVRYEIEKKAGIANFAGQPSWRSSRHKLIDIRFSSQNPSEFYVFAYDPVLNQPEFEKFISSLVFQNDQ